MKFIIARHGLTDHNQLNILSGKSDAPRLVEEGIEQARQIEKLYRYRRISAILCSPSMRAIQTIAPLAMALKIKPLICDELQEMDFGEMEGANMADVAGAVELHDHDLDYRFPGGESYRDMINRVMKLISKYSGPGPGIVFIQTHAGPMRVILASLLNLQYQTEPELLTMMEVENSRLFELNTDIQPPTCTWLDVLSSQSGKGLISAAEMTI